MEMRVEADPITQIAESESLSLQQHDEALAASVAGSFSAAQVYFSGPDAWIVPTIFVRLYARIGGGRLLLAEVALDSTAYTQEEGKTTALAIAVSGVQAEGFEVVLVQDNDSGVAVTEGRILLVAGASSAGTDIRPGSPAGLQSRSAQGAPAAQSGRWPVFLSDGSAEVGSAANALHVRKSDRRAAHYTSAIVGTGTSSTTDKSILYVWNDSTSKRAEIRRITISYLAGTGGNLTVRGAHIMAQASLIEGTSITPLPLDRSDGASVMSSVSEAREPTRVATDLILFAVPFSATGTFVWTWSDLGKPIVLAAGAPGGFEIRVDVSANATTEMKLLVSIEWLEI